MSAWREAADPCAGWLSPPSGRLAAGPCPPRGVSGGGVAAGCSSRLPSETFPERGPSPSCSPPPSTQEHTRALGAKPARVRFSRALPVRFSTCCFSGGRAALPGPQPGCTLLSPQAPAKRREQDCAGLGPSTELGCLPGVGTRGERRTRQDCLRRAVVPPGTATSHPVVARTCPELW